MRVLHILFWANPLSRRQALLAIAALTAVVLLGLGGLMDPRPAHAAQPCTDGPGVDLACDFDITELDWKATPAVMQVQARLEQGGLPVGDTSLNVVIVRLLRGGQTICQEQLTKPSGMTIVDSVLNLQVGYGMSCDLAETVATHVDLAMQICIDGVAHCLKPVELGLAPYAHRAAFAQIVQRASRAQDAVQANYARRATADRDMLVRRALSRGYFDFESRPADDLGAVYDDTEAAAAEGSGFALWAPLGPGGAAGDERDLILSGRETPEVGVVSSEQVRVLDAIKLHAETTELRGRLIVGRSAAHTTAPALAVEAAPGGPGGGLLVHGDTKIDGDLAITGALDVDGPATTVNGATRIKGNVTVYGGLTVGADLLISGPPAGSAAKGLTLLSGPTEVTGHSVVRGPVTASSVLAAGSATTNVGMRVVGTSTMRDLKGDGGLVVKLIEPVGGATLSLATSASGGATELDHRFDVPVIFQGAVVVDGAVELRGSTSVAGACAAGRAPDTSGNCRDIDECVMGLDSCHGLNQRCQNTAGGHTCVCALGTADNDGDGNCTDTVDACASGAFQCGTNAQCSGAVVVGLPTYSCSCPAGWIGNGYSRCIDADECLLGTQTCGANSFCVNRPAGAGAFCRCSPGFLDLYGNASECQPPAARWFTTAAGWLGGELGGLGGADAKCNIEASAGNKTGTFVAWLSTESEPASVRLPTLVDAGSPIRLFDGSLFAASGLAGILSTGAIDRAPSVGVGGQFLTPGVWTGTAKDGTFIGATAQVEKCGSFGWLGLGCDDYYDYKQACVNWTQQDTNIVGKWTTATAWIGNSGVAGPQFSRYEETKCNAKHGLYCLSRQAYRATRMFVTKGKWDGNLGGPAGADAKCQAEADQARLRGTWKMLTFASAKPVVQPYAMPLVQAWDSKVVSTNGTTLDRNELQSPLNRAADGTVIATGEPVWTQRDSTGSCTGFTSAATSSATATDYGLVGGAGPGWSTQSSGNANCFVPLHLYCIEVF